MHFGKTAVPVRVGSSVAKPVQLDGFAGAAGTVPGPAAVGSMAVAHGAAALQAWWGESQAGAPVRLRNCCESAMRGLEDGSHIERGVSSFRLT